jgi:hypothetical protein
MCVAFDGAYGARAAVHVGSEAELALYLDSDRRRHLFGGELACGVADR